MNKTDLENDIKQGLSISDLCERYMLSYSTIRYWLKKFNLQTNYKSFSEGGTHYGTNNNKSRGSAILEQIKTLDWIDIQNFYDAQHTTRDIIEKYNLSFYIIGLAKDEGLFKVRSSYETALIRDTYKLRSLKIPIETRREWGKKGGGYRENAGRSRKFKVLDSFGKECTLQSSYELEFSKILDENNIKWIRPSFLKYSDKKYFPDFYLPQFNVYFDTKNDYLIIKDAQKIASVIQENNIKLFIIRKDQININHILSIILSENSIN